MKLLQQKKSASESPLVGALDILMGCGQDFIKLSQELNYFNALLSPGFDIINSRGLEYIYVVNKYELHAL